MRAVGYIGPLCLNEDNGARVRAAIDSMEQFCAEAGHYLHKVFGAQTEIPKATDRNTYQSLVEYFASGDSQPALVLLADSSHLASGLIELVHRLITLEIIGAQVKCTNAITTDPLQSGLLLLGAYQPLGSSQKRAREAIISKAERGEVLGRTPFGYLSGLDGILKPKAEEACIVRNIFTWYTGAKDPKTFDSSNQLGTRKIATRLNTEGILTRSRGYWTPSTVGALLRNRAYVGTYSRFGVIIGSNHAPIVNRKIFEAAQELIRSRRPIRAAATQVPSPRQNVELEAEVPEFKLDTGMFPERLVASFIVPLAKVTLASGSVIVLSAPRLAGEAMVTLLVLSLSNSFKVPVDFTLNSAISQPPQSCCLLLPILKFLHSVCYLQL